MAEHEAIKTDLSPDIALLHNHVLPRLPAKSVTRFKCVSKQWHSFITTPRFPKMHLHHLNQPKLLFLPHNRPWEFFTIDCEIPEDGCTAIRPLPFKVGRVYRLLIEASLHGMICVFLSKPRDNSHIILWNPVTGDYKTLSKTGSHKDCFDDCKARYGLYYTSSEDDYKIVCLTRYPINVYIYSLKSDSWRKVESTDWASDRNQYGYRMGRSVLLNEKLYFVNSYSIMMFDTETEKPRAIENPHFGDQRSICLGFMVVRDCIHFQLGTRIDPMGEYDRIEEWRMDGDGDLTMVKTCSLEEHLYYWSYDSKHCHLMRNGNSLMYSNYPQELMRNKYWHMHNPWEGCVYVLDANNHTKHIMYSIKFSFRPQETFVETFVSPNQYLK